VEKEGKAMRRIQLGRIPVVLSEEEIARMFLVSEKNPRDNVLLKCIYYLGMKPSELRRFKIKDIDFENNIVKINGKRTREVPAPDEFIKELQAFINKREGLVFVGRDSSGSLSDRHIRRVVKQYACEANVRFCEKIHPHTLRHSYAVHLQKSGLSIASLQRFLGHKRKETTEIYIHTDLKI